MQAQPWWEWSHDLSEGTNLTASLYRISSQVRALTTVRVRVTVGGIRVQGQGQGQRQGVRTLLSSGCM